MSERNLSRPSTRDHSDGVVGRRIVAYLVDAIVLGGPALAIAGRLERTTFGRVWRALVIAGGGGILYHVPLEGTWGRTVGKRLLGVVVVRDDGEPCSYRAAAVRTALRSIDWLPIGYLVGLIAIGVTEKRQRVGDVAANTRVVRTTADRERVGDQQAPTAATGRA